MSRRSFDDPTSDEARQALLDNRTERKHPKRHRTTKRSKRIGQKKRARVKLKNARREKALRLYNALVSKYWKGEIDEHPRT